MVTMAIAILISAPHGQPQQGPILPPNGTLSGEKATRAPITSANGRTGPKDVGVVHALIGPDPGAKMISLEAVRGRVVKYTDFLDSVLAINVRNPRSPVRFEWGKTPRFLVTLQPYTQLPTRFELYSLTKERGMRKLFLLREDLESAEFTGSAGYHVRVSHYCGDVYMLQTEDLMPGEYAFKYSDDTKDLRMSCFGIDSF